MIKLACFGNNYSLLIYLLLTNTKFRKDVIFIFENINIKVFKRSMIINIKNNKYTKEIYFLVLVKILLFLYRKNILVYGQDHLLIGNKLLAANNFYLIEDGLMNYSINQVNQEVSKLRKIFNYLMGRNKYLGLDKGVKKIYLTGLAPIPEEIKNKVEIINLKELWNKKTEEEKEEILDIFGFNNSIIERLKNKKEVLYTQPLSEDAVITEEEKIEIYTKVIKNYKKETLVIKQHPREKTDYKKIFPDIEILNQSFPAELFNLLGIKFEKAITLFSTAALSNKNIEVDFYGTEVHPKILKRFGKMSNIMQNNAFIKEENDE